MPGLSLVVGNKNYSSWSMRPWLAMRHLGLDFEETVIPLDQPETARQIALHSAAGKVPVLHHMGITVWESLAILEYLDEIYPEKELWPSDREARAMARAVANEMHAGFAPLRNALPMNLRRERRPPRAPLSEEVKANIARIEGLWRNCRRRHGRAGPFLFGRFSSADAMYAPVATRLDTYAVEVADDTRDYMDTILELPAFKDWKQGAARESWTIAADEID
jgi:glutathione S-transferase